MFGARTLRSTFLVLAHAQSIWGYALPVKRTGEVRVQANDTTYVGNQVNAQDVFLGIPYAQPPVGNLRFRKPVALTSNGTINVQNYGPRCLQSTIANDASEDCLSLNIWRPQQVTEPLPVMVWIYGGSFILGDSQSYPGYGIVGKSIEMGQPVIYVSMNYRLGFFGFPVGKQTMNKGAANLGLHDQRMALEWVQNNIQHFGGDPTKVTLFGESAGGIGVSYQMMYRGGDIGNAFRAAIMQSGAPSSFKPSLQDSSARQQAYDEIASQTGCSKASDSFECLRTMDVSQLQAAHVGTYKLPQNAVAFANFPTAYGPVTITGDDFLPSSTTSIIQSGKYANIPIISGSNLDEGTWFVAATDSFLDLVEFLNTDQPGLAIGLSPSISSPMCDLYPNVSAAGSPYNTGNETFGRGDDYKWAASIVGDYLFTAPRRQLIQAAASRGQRVWSYMFSQPTAGAVPEYGISHTSEIPYVFGGLTSNATQGSNDVSDKMMQYWINFARTLDPRPDGSNLPAWPTYGTLKNMLQLKADDYSVIIDTFRESATQYIINTILGGPLP
ncbi:unnamed protein product [Rhizoctonia solani]|uniref:Carboxylic ester hydrolase n=3 Tax=Rhizoctonia solani TaxID=456999 RepID=A0A8H2WMK9_9AGAM|nr:esterase/lipase [Rhizoctonia solani AG-3 Rhs1AP]KEP52641.1 esterase/lipase [Rhizoctonia solani 123E]CAE6393777.1 unnamed protein product [Rhizoctonia solani]CAE6465716.1 unnamed protein product [Rhizoctonia solani]